MFSFLIFSKTCAIFRTSNLKGRLLKAKVALNYLTVSSIWLFHCSMLCCQLIELNVFGLSDLTSVQIHLICLSISQSVMQIPLKTICSYHFLQKNIYWSGSRSQPHLLFTKNKLVLTDCPSNVLLVALKSG